MTDREKFKKVVWDRAQVDLEDEWSDMTPALTEAQLAEARALITAAVTEEGNWPAPTEYTCDDCDHRFVCPLLFDSYNTKGDCLLEK
jgi:acyl-CoA reductase-like NAD-dependent aldehyde dehydrogenase